MTKRGEELTLTLDRVAFEGKGVSRHDGLVVFVRGGVPGDRLRVRLTRVKKSFAEAETLEILTPSPLRTAPRCRYAGLCGGCTWQHVDYEAQLAFKRDHVADALERIGGFRGVSVLPTLGSENRFFYRNKMEFSFGKRWLTLEEIDGNSEEAGRFGLGLHLPKRFDRVLDVEECWLQSETSVRVVNAVREFCRSRDLSIYSTVTHTGYLRHLVVREGKRTGERMVNLVTSEKRPELMREFRDHLLRLFPDLTTICNIISTRKAQVAIGEEEDILHGPGFITEKLGGKVFRVSPGSFFQTNTVQAEILYTEMRRMAALTPEDVVYDCYSGTGTIALVLADDASAVVGFESVPEAVEDAHTNADLNGIKNCRFLFGDLKETLSREADRHLPERPLVVILDPPRAGLHAGVVSAVRRLAPRRVVYASCNPATQARDCALLCADESYLLTRVQPVDMFPHTFHIESVACLERRPGKGR